MNHFFFRGILWAAIGLPVAVLAQEKSPDAPRLYPAVVVAEEAVVYAQPDLEAPKLEQFQKGALVDVLSQRPEWYRVRLISGEGVVGSGWVKKSGVQLMKGSASEGMKSIKTEAFSGLGTNLGYIYNIHRYGTYQIRAGAEYDLPLSADLSLGVPVSFTFLGGFKSIQPGAVLLWRFWSNGAWGARVRGGVLYDYFFGNGKSFESMALDLGLGLTYRPKPWLLLELEGASVEYNPVNTNHVPAFLRGQALAKARFVW